MPLAKFLDITTWQELIRNGLDYVTSFSILIISVLAGLLLHVILIKLLKTFTSTGKTRVTRSLSSQFKSPLRLLLPLFVINLTLPLLTLNLDTQNFLRNTVSTLFIVAFTWLLIKLTGVIEAVLEEKYELKKESISISDRRIYTQIDVFKKIVVVLIVIIALIAIIMSFDDLRQLGTTLLASAGVLGIIIGFAAQRSVATLFAGFQIALTQPIRIRDAVTVENEYGTIEEITLTFVVVKLWDLRRLIVPITYFIDKPFQNWTYISADVLGTVTLYTDYNVSIQAIREKLQEILQGSSYWDGKVSNVQVVEARENALEIRTLMSAVDAPTLWNLRCEVREKLVTFLQEEHPQSLVKVHTVVEEPKNP
jgi:small-conductance mechanosensitive channel